MPKITFKFADGQLVKLQEDRPEEAHALTDVPTEFLREYCLWADPLNGFIHADGTQGRYEDLDHHSLLKCALNWYEEALCVELKVYCDANELPYMSADELVVYANSEPRARQHVEWLTDFGRRWDEMVSLFHVAYRG